MSTLYQWAPRALLFWMWPKLDDDVYLLFCTTYSVLRRYAPAIRELFASVTLDNEEHAQGALSTLAADKRTDGALALTVRKVCLVIGDEASRKPPPPPRIPHANLTFAPPQVLPPQAAGGTAPPTQTTFTGPALPGGIAALAQLNNNVQPANANGLDFPGSPVLGPINPFQAGQLPQPNIGIPGASEDGWALELPSLQAQQLALEAILNGTSQETTLNEELESPSAVPVPLSLASALDFLAQTSCISALTIRIPTAELVDERTMSILSDLRLLRKLDIAGKLDFRQLWQLLKNLPCLEDLTISGLATGEEVDIPSYDDDFNSTKLQLHSLSIYRSELDTDLLHGILQSCGKNIINIKLSRFVTRSRLKFKAILQMVGPSLRSLAIHRLVFRGLQPLSTQPHLLYILDDLPSFCPMLEELQVAAERIVSPANFFATVLPSLFLTQLELDYYYPMVTEEQIMELIHSLPAGRTETLSFGSKMNHLLTPKVQRACQEIGIVVLGAEGG